MIITRYEKTTYPYNQQGKKMADYMENKLKQQGCFLRRSECTEFITIEGNYRFVIEDEET